MSSTRTDTQDTQRCDYIPCTKNLAPSDASKPIQLRKCGGCGLVRYCSRECQTGDWSNHKIWCKTHKASKDDDSDYWRRFHRRLPAWRRTHLPALKEALLAFLNLPKHPNTQRKYAFNLVVAYTPAAAPARCMHVQSMDRLSYTGEAAHFAASRAQYEAQLHARNPRAFYGAGLVVMTIARDGAAEARTYAVPVPITVGEAAIEAPLMWRELLALRLIRGEYLDPATSNATRDLVSSMFQRNLMIPRMPLKWCWTEEDTKAAAVWSSSIPNYTLQIMLGEDILNLFKFVYSSVQRNAVIKKLRSFIDELVFAPGQILEDPTLPIRCYSCMIDYFGSSVPHRWPEAEPYFHKLSRFGRHLPIMAVMESKDEFLFQHAVCLSTVAGREDDAVQAFARAARRHPYSQKPQLMARAFMSRMFRRVGRVHEAEEHELKAAIWIRDHPYVISVATLRTLLRDDHDPQGKNYILEDPLVVAVIDELSGTAVGDPFNYTLMLRADRKDITVIDPHPAI